MTTSSAAVTLRDKRSLFDLTVAARLRWILRTNAIHTLHPVVKLADGRLLVGDRTITTQGEFLSVESHSSACAGMSSIPPRSLCALKS